MVKRLVRKRVSIKRTKTKLITRIVISAVLFIIGFNFSYSSFFREYPLYGVPFLAEIIISVSAGLVGFYIIPKMFSNVVLWLENLIIKAVTEIVTNFWEQQTKNITIRKRAKQKRIARETEKEEKDELRNSIVLDTSVLVDGRILGIVGSGFLNTPLIVPEAVLNELHLISDNDDRLKRERGRRGLDVVNALKKQVSVKIPVIKNPEKDVDKSLIAFSKKNKLRLMTLDFNLNKLATINGIKVLNINDLMEAVKISVLPGEELEVKIVQKGKEREQGVGYSNDGTMIIVMGAGSRIGETLLARVQKVIQRSSGKIIFAELVKVG